MYVVKVYKLVSWEEFIIAIKFLEDAITFIGSDHARRGLIDKITNLGTILVKNISCFIN